MDYSKMPMNALCKHGIEINLICEKCRIEVAEQWPEVQATIPTVEVAGEAPKPQQPLDIYKSMRVKSSKQPVRVVCVDSVTSKIIMAISRSEGGEYLAFASEIHMHVENVPEKRKGWINLYRSVRPEHIAAASHVYENTQKAYDERNKFGQRIACIEIEWTD